MVRPPVRRTWPTISRVQTLSRTTSKTPFNSTRIGGVPTLSRTTSKTPFNSTRIGRVWALEIVPKRPLYKYLSVIQMLPLARKKRATHGGYI